MGRAERCRIESNSVFIARTEWRLNHKAAAGNCGTKLRPPPAMAQAKCSTIFLTEWNGGFTEKGAGGATGKCRFFSAWNDEILLSLERHLFD